MDEKGLYYIATGENFVREAEVSAKSVRSAMPDIPIAIATDIEPEIKFDHIINIPDPEYGFVDQILNLSRSPFEKTLHFDTDILVGSEVYDVFNLLDHFDIAAAHNHGREAYDLPGVPKSFPEYNTGVMAYRNGQKLQNFFQRWESNYFDLLTKENTQNQPSFRKTLLESNLRIATLTPEYNCMVRYPGHVRNEVKIAHSRLLNIQSPGAEKSVNVRNSLETLNSYRGHRLYEPDGNKGVTITYGRVPRDAPHYQQFINSIRMHGVVETIRSGIPYLIRQVRGDS